MRRSLLGAAVAGGMLATGSASGITWTVTGSTAGGSTVTVGGMNSGSINIGQTVSGRSADQVDNPTGVSSALQNALTVLGSGPMNAGETAFFGFQDSAGSNSLYFGVAYLFAGPASSTFSFDASIAGDQYGVMTNMNATHTGATGSGTYSVSGITASSPGLFYFLFAGVEAGQSISISNGLTGDNQVVSWLDWDGSAWLDAGSGDTGTTSDFTLLNATSPSAVPSGAAAALTGGLAAGLLRRRRARRA